MKILRSVFRRLTAGIIFTLLVGLFVLVVFWSRIVLSVPPGSVGVMWYLFFGGTRITSPVVKEGLHLTFPWDRLYIYDARLQSRDEDFTVISQDGLQFRMTLTFRWRVNPNTTPVLQKLYGPDYLVSLLVPEIGSITREIVSRYDVGMLVSDSRSVVGKEIYDQVVSYTRENGVGAEIASGDTKNVIMLRDVLIREVDLPEQLQKAIRDKLEQAQIVEEYKYRVDRERLESQRKAVEAQGIRNFQETVTPAISDSYLKWRGIEATMELSKSPNSKIVIMGSGEGGLPVILDGFGREAPEVVSKGYSGAPSATTAP
ncbi:prohibitin family protein [Aestuariivirga sp.]|jgi:regulator of protease activity HflC (stomatin/prohibitin superfamily)|uniref:prohibitin family protein n=1 Tax=Aestuariivirga sp. TaxID=2650926 RepID=UPI00378410EA